MPRATSQLFGAVTALIAMIALSSPSLAAAAGDATAPIDGLYRTLLETMQQAKQLGVDGAAVKKFLGWKENLEKMAEIAHTCTSDELIVHCLAAKAIIDKYRAAAAPVS